MQLETPLRCKLQEKIASCDVAFSFGVIGVCKFWEVLVKLGKFRNIYYKMAVLTWPTASNMQDSCTFVLMKLWDYHKGIYSLIFFTNNNKKEMEKITKNNTMIKGLKR